MWCFPTLLINVMLCIWIRLIVYCDVSDISPLTHRLSPLKLPFSSFLPFLSCNLFYWVTFPVGFPVARVLLITSVWHLMLGLWVLRALLSPVIPPTNEMLLLLPFQPDAWFFFPHHPAKSPIVTLNRNDENGHLCLVPDCGKGWGALPLTIEFDDSSRLLQTVFVRLMKFLCIPVLLSVFIKKGLKTLNSIRVSHMSSRGPSTWSTWVITCYTPPPPNPVCISWELGACGSPKQCQPPGQMPSPTLSLSFFLYQVLVKKW